MSEIKRERTREKINVYIINEYHCGEFDGCMVFESRANAEATLKNLKDRWGGLRGTSFNLRVKKLRTEPYIAKFCCIDDDDGWDEAE